MRFWQLLIDFRKRHPALRRERLFDGTLNERGVADVMWHGCALGAPGWNDPGSRVLSFTLGGFGGEPDVHAILNMDPQDLDFELPAVESRRWLRAFDTALPSPQDASEPGREPPVSDPHVYRAAGRSAVVVVSEPLP
jgi:isoamylase